METGWRLGSPTCTDESIVGRIERNRREESGSQRPMGGNDHWAIAALEDKVVQHAVGRVLNQIWEEDFLGFSLWISARAQPARCIGRAMGGIVRKKVNWILDLDIRSFFDKLQHEWLVKFVEHRIGDKRIVRLIQKWLKAGVMEQGQWFETEEGSSARIGDFAGACQSLPALRPGCLGGAMAEEGRRSGDVIIVRYADDAVLGFQHREEAERFLEQLRERLQKFGLELHPDKTRLIEFGRYAAERRKRRGEGKPETFNFLGFTHICGTNTQDGVLHGASQDDRQAHGSQAQRNSSATAKARRMSRTVKTVKWLQSSGAGVFPISRDSGQLGAPGGVSAGCAAHLV